MLTKPFEKATLMEAALRYLHLGWVPIPCCPPHCDAQRVPWHWQDGPCGKPAKTPLLRWRKWQEKKPQERDLISWWGRWPWANVGIITGTISGIVVIDAEAGVSLDGYPIPPTVLARSGSGGRHYFFKHPGHPVQTKARIFGPNGPAVDVRGDGGFVVVAPSRHPSGGAWEWIISPENEQLAELPEWVMNALGPSSNGRRDWAAVAEGALEGHRNETLASYIGKVLTSLSRELWDTAGWVVARDFAARCTPPLDEEEARSVFESICKREAAKRTQKARQVVRPPYPPVPWTEVEAVARRWLELADLDVLKVLLAAVVANRLDGDPVWLFLIAPPASAKTELLSALFELPYIYPLSTLTENTLLSGKDPKETKGQKVSLLPELNEKILVLKDFTSILELRPDTRQAILSQLREVYDGQFAKGVGNQPTLRWKGKLGLIAGVTEAVDLERYTGLHTTLGERFIQYRIAASDENATLKKAIANIGREKQMREELKRAFGGFLEYLDTSPLDVDLPEQILNRISALVRLVIRARTGVIRDYNGKREIIYTPEHEGPARLGKQLVALGVGLARLRGSQRLEEQDYSLLYRVGLDSIHKLRRRVLSHLAACNGNVATPDIATSVRLSTQTTRRFLEDLEAVGLVERTKAGGYETAPDLWRLTPEARALWEEA